MSFSVCMFQGSNTCSSLRIKSTEMTRNHSFSSIFDLKDKKKEADAGGDCHENKPESIVRRSVEGWWKNTNFPAKTAFFSRPSLNSAICRLLFMFSLQPPSLPLQSFTFDEVFMRQPRVTGFYLNQFTAFHWFIPYRRPTTHRCEMQVHSVRRWVSLCVLIGLFVCVVCRPIGHCLCICEHYIFISMYLFMFVYLCLHKYCP